MIRIALMTAALIALAAALPGTAGAHAGYDRSVPAKNAVIEQAPERVDVWFTQEIFRQEGANFVRVFGPDDQQVSEGDGMLDDDDRTHMFATLPAGLPDGRYVVRWQTLSDADGDQADGAFCFFVGVELTADQQTECAALAGDDAFTPGPVGTAPAVDTPTTAPPTPTEAAAEPTATPADAAPTPPATEEDDDGTNTSAVIGIIVGVVIAVAVVGGGAYYLWRRRAA